MGNLPNTTAFCALLYEAPKPKNYAPASVLPVSIDSKFDILFNHRWQIFCQMSGVPFAPMAPHLLNFQIGYHGPVVYRSRFDNMFCIPVNSAYYEGLSQVQKETFTHNLIKLYEAVYVIIAKNPTPGNWNKLINATIAHCNVIK